MYIFNIDYYYQRRSTLVYKCSELKNEEEQEQNSKRVLFCKKGVKMTYMTQNDLHDSK